VHDDVLRCVSGLRRAANVEKSDHKAYVGMLDRAKALFATALASDTSFWGGEVERNKRIDDGYYGMELLVEFDVPEGVGFRGVVFNLPLRKLRQLRRHTVAGGHCDNCGTYYLAMGDHPAVFQVWKNRLYTVTHVSRPDAGEVDALLAVYAAMFSPLVTKVRVEVLRPQRGHFEDLPTTWKGREAQEYFSRFAI
jgi:hypothetical protein